MKGLVLMVVAFLALYAGALAQVECKDCAWYDTRFQAVADSLKKTLNSPGRVRVSEYNLSKLLVDMQVIEFPCAMEACKGQEAAIRRIKLKYSTIKSIIYSGQVKPQEPE